MNAAVELTVTRSDRFPCLLITNFSTVTYTFATRCTALPPGSQSGTSAPYGTQLSEVVLPALLPTRWRTTLSLPTLTSASPSTPQHSARFPYFGLRRSLSLWRSNPLVRVAQRRLQQLRRSRRDTKEAEKALGAIYRKQQEIAVGDAIHAVTSVVPDRKNEAVWSPISILTSRKRRTPMNLSGNSPEERKNEAQKFFASAVNILPPILSDSLQLPHNTPLPDPAEFSIGSVTPAEVIQLAKTQPGGKAMGPDEVPVEVFRIP